MRLKKVTPKALKVLSKYKLDVIDNQQYVQNLLKVAQDEKAVQEVCETIFDEDFSQTDFAEMDLSEFHKGVRDFLSQFLLPSSA